MATEFKKNGIAYEINIDDEEMLGKEEELDLSEIDIRETTKIRKEILDHFLSAVEGDPE